MERKDFLDTKGWDPRPRQTEDAIVLYGSDLPAQELSEIQSPLPPLLHG